MKEAIIDFESLENMTSKEFVEEVKNELAPFTMPQLHGEPDQVINRTLKKFEVDNEGKIYVFVSMLYDDGYRGGNTYYVQWEFSKISKRFEVLHRITLHRCESILEWAKA